MDRARDYTNRFTNYQSNRWKDLAVHEEQRKRRCGISFFNALNIYYDQKVLCTKETDINLLRIQPDGLQSARLDSSYRRFLISKTTQLSKGRIITRNTALYIVVG